MIHLLWKELWVSSGVFSLITINDRPLTRRRLLSTVNSIYDPFGILAPVVLFAKKLLQDLCRKGLDWDDMIPPSAALEWTGWLKEPCQLKYFKVDRCLKPEQFGEIASAQLHHFADASEDCYGTVSYLLLHNNHGHVHCAFIMGKARVAPLKPVTIPRMELTAAVVAGRMDKMWRKELQLQLQGCILDR